MKAKKMSKILKHGFIFAATILVWYFSVAWIHNSIHLLFMITLGHWAWTTNLDVLYRQGVDPLSMLEHVSGYQVSNNYSIAIFMSLLCCLFSWLNGFVGEMVTPLAFVLLALFWINPFKLYKSERMSILGAVYRSVVITRVDLSEVLLCDIFTSFSRITSQMMLETFWFAFPSNKTLYHANLGKLATRMDIIVPLLVAYF
jgi:hypothetical protein